MRTDNNSALSAQQKEFQLLLKLENDLAEKRVKIIQNDDNLDVKITSQKSAREIMGSNFFGIKEAIEYFKIQPTPEQLIDLAKVPFSRDTLDKSKDTHILAAVFPISILDIRKSVESLNLFRRQSWYESWQKKLNHANGKEKTASWRLVSKTLVEGSISKTWEEQKSLIGKDEEIPPAEVMIYIVIANFFTNNGEQLLKKFSVRTSSVLSVGYRVTVGPFTPQGLHIGNKIYDQDRLQYLGVASAKRIPKFLNQKV